MTHVCNIFLLIVCQGAVRPFFVTTIKPTQSISRTAHAKSANFMQFCKVKLADHDR